RNLEGIVVVSRLSHHGRAKGQGQQQRKNGNKQLSHYSVTPRRFVTLSNSPLPGFPGCKQPTPRTSPRPRVPHPSDADVLTPRTPLPPRESSRRRVPAA